MFLKIITAVILIFLISSNLQAASPEDVQKVVQLVQTGNAKELFRKFPMKEKRYTTISFSQNHTGYKVIYFPANDTHSSDLQYWMVKKEWDWDDSVVFDDGPIDGVVDQGAGPREGENFFNESSKNGMEHRQHWQKLYDAAIADTLEFFNQNKP